MDPVKTSQRALEAWIREMGFVNMADPGNLSTIVAIATSTPDRRRLWDMIIRRFRDRRIVKKVRRPENRDGDIEVFKHRIALASKEVQKVKEDIKRYSASIEAKVQSIQNAEKTIHEDEIKKILFYRRRKKHLAMVKAYQIMQGEIQKAEQGFRHGFEIDLASLFGELTVTTRNRLCDVASRLALDNGFWEGLVDEQRRIANLNETESKIKDLNSELRSHLPAPVMSWATYLEKQKNNCVIAENLVVLIKGLGLKRIISSPVPIKDEVLESVERYLKNGPIEEADPDELLSDDAMDSLRRNAEDSQLAYENLRTEVIEMRAIVQELFTKSCTSQRSLAVLNSSLNAQVAVDAKLWRELLQTRTRADAKHIRTMCDSSLAQLRYKNSEQTVSNAENGQKPCECQDVVLSSYQPTPVDFRPLLQKLEKTEDPDLNGIRGKRLMRTLRLTTERIGTLRENLGLIRQIMTLTTEQPFINMIPDSLVVSGLSFKEWKMQHAINAVAATNRDQSNNDTTLNYTISRN